MKKMTSIELRPSAAHTWVKCPGQPVLVAALALPNETSIYAEEGTAAHKLAAMCLETGTPAIDYLDEEVHEATIGSEKHVFTVDEEMAKYVQDYLDGIELVSHNREVLVEQQMDIGKVIKVQKQTGTADAVIIGPKSIEVRDLKYGKGIIVAVKNNYQLLLYAAAAYLEHKGSHEFKHVRMVIHQPRVSEPLSWTISVRKLVRFIKFIRGKAAAVHAELQKYHEGAPLKDLDLRPGESQCQFCPAMSRCPKLAEQLFGIIGDDVDDLTGDVSLTDDIEALEEKRSWVGLMEKWCTAVCGEVKSKLEAGVQLEYWKLAEGRKGHRAYPDPDALAKRLKGMRLRNTQIFCNLATPSQLEGLLSESRYESLVEEGLIVQPPGKLTVVPMSSGKDEVTPPMAFESLD